MPFNCFGIIIILAYILKPNGYTITPQQFIIHRYYRTVKISRDDLGSARYIERKDVNWAVRLFGIGGLFGYVGKFSSHKIGNATWHVTNRNHAVLITFISGKKVLISPANVNAFLKQLYPDYAIGFVTKRNDTK